MNISRLASVIVAAGYLVASVVVRGKPTVELFIIAIGVCPPLMLIWFPYAFGNYIGPVRGGYIDTPTPDFLVAVGGWILLLVVPAMWYFLGHQHGH